MMQWCYLTSARTFEPWIVHFIEKIKSKKNEIDWGTLISDNINDQLETAKDDP